MFFNWTTQLGSFLYSSDRFLTAPPRGILSYKSCCGCRDGTRSSLVESLVWQWQWRKSQSIIITSSSSPALLLIVLYTTILANQAATGQLFAPLRLNLLSTATGNRLLSARWKHCPPACLRWFQFMARQGRRVLQARLPGLHGTSTSLRLAQITHLCQEDSHLAWTLEAKNVRFLRFIMFRIMNMFIGVVIVQIGKPQRGCRCWRV